MFSKKKSNKSNILKIFNIQIQEFFKKIISFFPKDDSIKSLNRIVDTLCKYNPVKLISIWHFYIEQPYFDIIQKGDFNYFQNKNYATDLADLKGNSEYVLKSYNKLRISISQLNNDSKMIAMKYVQILTKLSQSYFL